MEKKKISIIGTCISRELFNNPVLTDNFSVDCYAFQVCPWALFQDGLKVSKEVVYKAGIEEFTQRICWYELDKTAISEIEKHNSEYLIIDLHAMVGKAVEVTYNGKTIHTQSSFPVLEKYLSNIENYKIEELKGISYKKIDDFDSIESIVYDGLKKLAKWAMTRFEPSKIIVHVPKCAYSYIPINDTKEREYNEGEKGASKRIDILHEKWSNVLINEIPGCTILDDLHKKVSHYEVYDNPDMPVPPRIHYTFDNITKQAMRLLEKLNIPRFRRIDDVFSEEICKLQNKALLVNKEIQLHAKYLPNMNNYFDKIESFDNSIIVFATQNDASSNLKFFKNQRVLKHLTFKINPQECYIGIMDMRNGVYYEKSSAEDIEYSYLKLKIKGVVSSKTGFASISKDGAECSLQSNGINISVFDAESFELIDSAFCSPAQGKNLLVYSNSLKNARII